jgi:SpoVK/Ycf46/Vps4 family AAA+-type ATPase
VLAELERIDILLERQVARSRRQPTGAHDDEPGLAAFYVPDAEVDALLSTPTAGPDPADPLAGDPVQHDLDRLTDAIRDRAVASLEAGVYLRLVALAQLFGLAAFDIDVVLVCLAPELDRRYERLYAYLHDDVTARRPTVGLVLDLCCPDLATRVMARSRFGTAAPLVGHHLVQLTEPVGPHAPTLLNATLQLDPGVTRFVLEDDQLDDRLRPVARLVSPATTTDGLVLPADCRDRVLQLVDVTTADGSDLVVYLQGPYGVGKQAVAEACSHAIGVDLLVVDGRRLAERPADEFDALVHLVDREARLQGALLYVDGFDTLLADDRHRQLATLLGLLDRHPGPTFLAGDTTWEPTDALHGVSFVRLPVPPPGYDERVALWEMCTAGIDQADDVDLAALATSFRLTGGQIADAAATARSLARARSATALVTEEDLQHACRLQSNRKLGELALPVTPVHTWDDLVLPADQLEQLGELADQVRYRPVVHDAWGFGRKLATGRGLNVLFAGPPGTGKTMAAEVLANTLGLDLYKIDLSGVLSKYIGETERNLARIFDEARTSNAILFFDEADALFGKRTQVRDAHDRYANVEVSYLLQRLEEHEGLVVLATNLRKNMDEAFVRRLHVTVDFPMPGLEDRRRIWARMWPPPAPLDPALDLDALARDVPVSGGAIRNIALAGAFLAAADGGVVTMEHLLHATRREYEKMGKVLTGSELGRAS